MLQYIHSSCIHNYAHVHTTILYMQNLVRHLKFVAKESQEVAYGDQQMLFSQPKSELERYIHMTSGIIISIKRRGVYGCQGMKKKGNKKMPTQRHKLIHNPIPTSLFCFKILFVCCECIGQRKTIFTSNWLHEIHCGLER